MRIPQKLEYACRALVQLAQNPGEVSQVHDLAEKEAISSSYLLQILNELRHAGLVESRRGKNGGYLLARSPDLISLKDIVVAIEGSVLETGLEEEGASAGGVARAWQSVSTDLEKSLDLWTLERMSTGEIIDSYMI